MRSPPLPMRGAIALCGVLAIGCGQSVAVHDAVGGSTRDATRVATRCLPDAGRADAGQDARYVDDAGIAPSPLSRWIRRVRIQPDPETSPPPLLLDGYGGNDGYESSHFLVHSYCSGPGNRFPRYEKRIEWLDSCPPSPLLPSARRQARRPLAGFVSFVSSASSVPIETASTFSPILRSHEVVANDVIAGPRPCRRCPFSLIAGDHYEPGFPGRGSLPHRGSAPRW